MKRMLTSKDQGLTLVTSTLEAQERAGGGRYTVFITRYNIYVNNEIILNTWQQCIIFIDANKHNRHI